MKKLIAVVLSLCMLLPFALFANAQETPLQFDENGEFKILHLTDCQDGYPASETMMAYIRFVLAEYDPDLVVLGGDNTVGPAETKAQAIEELVAPFVESETYFTLVFGNHDGEQGVDRPELFALYQQYGGEYCLAYDAVPELFGVGTHNLPVLSSDGTKIAFNVWMFDSNTYAEDENGDGYDCVHEDQIEWYKQTAAALAEENDGEVVPAMSFQHIIVGEIYEALFTPYPSALAVPEITRTFYGVSYGFTPQYDRITSGHIAEFPCSGYFNYGQFDAFLEVGDMIATFSGHDHTNTFTVPYKGIDIVNTPAPTYHSYANDFSRGARLITVHEEDAWNYDSELLFVFDAILDGDDEALNATPDASKFAAMFHRLFAKIVDIFAKILGFMQGLV